MLLALCVALTGCMSFNPRSLRQMESALRASNPDMEFSSTTKFGVGPLTMDLVDFVFVHDRHIDVSKISRADVGIYELKRPLASLDFKLPQGTDRSCPRREVVLRVTEDDERVEMAVCIRGDEVTGFAMFMVERDEVVVMNIRGDIQALVSAAIRENVNRESRRERTAADAGPVPGIVAAADDVDVHIDEHRDVHVDIHRDVQAGSRTPRS
jgi:hypothetical protein